LFWAASDQSVAVGLLMFLKVLVERVGVGVLPLDFLPHRSHLLYNRVRRHIKPPSIPQACK